MTADRVSPHPRLRGVNLGGWLVLEKWMKPSLFAGLAATDETSWCVELGAHAAGRLRHHWASFITREDLAWLADIGINGLRIPIGHWILGPPYPYHAAYGTHRSPFVAGGIDVLDHAMHWAEDLGLRVVLDLHAAPGCQNGFDNGGIKDVCDWHRREEYPAYSVELLGRLAARYGSSSALYGIEVLNEPRRDVPTPLLRAYTVQAYHAIRAHCTPERVAVVFQDGFRSHREYLGSMAPPAFRNVLFDIHRYQCFERSDVDLDIHAHLHKAAVLRKDEGDAIRRELELPVIVGEWSLGLDPKAVSPRASGPLDHALEPLDTFQRDVAMRAFAAAQLLSFERHDGWFFWSYRTETAPAWSFRDCVERGWLPRRFH